MSTSPESSSTNATAPQRLPLAVIIPTCNHSAQIPAHLSALDRWLDLAAEVAVVDAYSADGTMELLRAGLFHRQLQFYHRPEGFHAGINFGVTQLESEFIYISQPGDTITRDGILHLVGTAQKLGCDVLLSPPQEEAAGDADPGIQPAAARCPVEDIIRKARPAEPALLRRTGAFYVALAQVMTGRAPSLLGRLSCDLFRAGTLRANPFPAESGPAGDTLWVLRHGLEIQFGVTPLACAAIHPPEHDWSARDKEAVREARKLAPPIAADALGSAMRDPNVPDRDDLNHLQSYLEEAQALIEAQRTLNQSRRRDMLWFLRPAIWKARASVKGHLHRWRQADSWLRQRPLLAAKRTEG